MNAVAYLRVSGTSQLDGGGFDRQLIACHAWAALHAPALTLAEVFREEAISGTKDREDRPAFQSMVAYMLDSGINVLVIESLDRLAREYRVQEQLLLYLAAKGIQLHTANTGENITAAIMGDPMKKALVQIQGVFAELDRSMIVAKLRKGRERTKATAGRCEGRKPYGDKPGEAPVLARIRSMRAQGLQCKDIAAQLNADAVAARSGGIWHGPVVAKILRREAVAHRLQSKDGCDAPLYLLQPAAGPDVSYSASTPDALHT